MKKVYILTALAIAAPLWIRQIRFERFMAQRTRLFEVGVSENLDGFADYAEEVNRSLKSYVDQINKRLRAASR